MEAAVMQMERTIDMRFEQLIQTRQAPGGFGSASGSEHQQNQMSDNPRLPGSADSSQAADNSRLGRGLFSPRSSHSLPMEPSNANFEVGTAPPSIRPILVNRSRSGSTSSQDRSVSFEGEVQHIPDGAFVGSGEVSVLFTSIASLVVQDGTKTEFSGADADGAHSLLQLDGSDTATGPGSSSLTCSGGGIEEGTGTAAGPSAPGQASFGGSGGVSDSSALSDLTGLVIDPVAIGSGGSGLNVNPFASIETEQEVAVVSVDQPEEVRVPICFTTTFMELDPTHATFRAEDFSQGTVGSVRALSDSSGQSSSYLEVSTTAVSSTPLVGLTAARTGLSESSEPSLRPTASLPVGRVKVNFSVVSEVGLSGGPSPVASHGAAPHPDRIMRDSMDVTDQVASRPVKKVRARQPRIVPGTGSPLRTRAGTVRGDPGAPGGSLFVLGPSDESAGPGIEPGSNFCGAEDLLT